MELKPSEIVVLVLALALPVAVLGALAVPGVTGAVFEFVFKPANARIVFGGLAALVAIVLGFRIFRRIRPAKRKTQKADDTSLLGLFRPPGRD